MRPLLRPLALVSGLVLVHCSDPQVPPHPGVVATPAIEVVAISVEPKRETPFVPPVVRITVALSKAATPAIVGESRVLLVRGALEPADVALLAKGRSPAGLRDREIPLTTWGAPAMAPEAIVIRPTRVLPAGHATLVVVVPKSPPHVLELEVDASPVARRLWPVAARAGGGPLTYCLPGGLTGGLPAGATGATTLDPLGIEASVARLEPSGCLDFAFAPRGPVVLPPPSIGDVLLDPEPIALGAPPTPPEEGRCPEGALDVEGLCVRVDDDRVVLLGGAFRERLALGKVGPAPVLAALPPRARVVVRGLSPARTWPLDLRLREIAREERHLIRTIRTGARRRHVVINEVLSRPRSGSSSQRFVELVNDGDHAVDLLGLILVDGGTEIELPSAWLEPGAFALVTPEGFVDGLAGDAAPPAGVLRLWVDALKLTGDLAVIERDGAVLSRFPASSSTRTISRGRRAPDRPDDAEDAFGWDAAGRATPGLANVIAPEPP